MTKNKSDKFLKLVGKHREQKKAPKFEGTLSDYLAVLEKDPSVTKLAHKRLFDSIAAHGVKKMDNTNDRTNSLFAGEEVRVYDYFQKKFFGMERSLAKIMRFLRSASLK